MTTQSASREVATWATLRLGPDALDVALFGTCYRSVDARIECRLERIEYEGRDITAQVREEHPEQIRAMSMRLACEYIAEPLRRHSSDAYVPEHDDGPPGAA